MDIRKQFGLRMKGLRIEKGLSQEKLALAASLDRTYITTVENGKRNISIVNIEKIARTLNISLKEFFNIDWK